MLLVCALRTLYILARSVKECIRKCKQAVDSILSMERELWKSGMLIKPTLLMLEKSILDLMAYNVTEGMFYGQVLEFGGKTIVRHMENGSLCSFIGHRDIPAQSIQ